jgi:hypothetical protein
MRRTGILKYIISTELCMVRTGISRYAQDYAYTEQEYYNLHRIMHKQNRIIIICMELCMRRTGINIPVQRLQDYACA